MSTRKVSLSIMRATARQTRLSKSIRTITNPRPFSTTQSRKSIYPSTAKINAPPPFSTAKFLASTSQLALSNAELPDDIRNNVSGAGKTKQMNMFQAINDALAICLETDETACIFGEDVAFGGVFRCTMGLAERFGGERVFNTPLCEQGIAGFAIGLSAAGITAIPEIQFADYSFPALDQLHNEAAKYRYRSSSTFPLARLVVRIPTQAVGHGAMYHSQSPENFFMASPGLTVVCPRSPVQAKGLLLASLRGPDPVVFMEPKILYRGSVEEVPVGEYHLPLRKAEILQTGTKCTLVSYGAMLYTAQAAIEALAAHHPHLCPPGSIELIDLRTINPWDKSTILSSIRKTGRLVVLHEGPTTMGVGAEIAAAAVGDEETVVRLQAPVRRVTGPDVHVPLAFERFVVPDVVRVFDALKEVLEYE